MGRSPAAPATGLGFVLLALCLGAPAGAIAQPQPLPHIARLDPNDLDFPDATLADCSDLLDAPAGRHGFMFVGSDGHFHFEDGTSARFFGLNVAKDAVFQPRSVIDAATAAIARAGFNLVRLHHLDDETGLLPASRAGSAQRLDAQKLDAVDYWIAALKKRGVYVYLDLLDYRTFRPEEGVPDGPMLGRGAKPCAFYNERLLELQREYARQLLLEHTNPYTGLTYAADPAVCMLELCDENGLFHERERLSDMPQRYRGELLRRWGFWLLSEYGSRDELARTWTDDSGACALAAAEDPRKSNVGLPGVSANCDDSVPRLASAGMFMAALHREYFRGMIEYLRQRGVQCPISAVTAPRELPDLWASAQELDFIAANYYFDHPYFRSGSEWQLPAFFSGDSPVRSGGQPALGPIAAAARVAGKPLVIREWGICWPNDNRAAGMLEAVAYASLQDVDAMILFAYDTRSDRRRLDYFDVRCDPARWGLAPLCARAFLQRQISPALRTVTLAHTAADVFYPDCEQLPTRFHDLCRVAGLQSAFGEDEVDSLGELTVLSGRTAAAKVTGQRTIICSNAAVTDAYGRGNGSSAARSGYPAPARATTLRFDFGGTLFPKGTSRNMVASPFAIPQGPAAQDLRPIGVSADGRSCLGLRDMARGNYVFGRLDDDLKLRCALDALAQLHGARTDGSALDRNCLTSDTGELVLDRNAGVLWVATPLLCAVAGELGGAGPLTAGPLGVTTGSRTAACVWQSLDGLPLAQSARWTVKLVSVSRNSGQEVRVHLQKKEKTIYALDGPGSGPVTTLGRTCETPTELTLAGRAVIRLLMQNGLLELHRDGGRLWAYCDTPGVQTQLPGRGDTAVLTAYDRSGAKRELQVTQPFPWPEGVAVLEAAWRG